MTRFEKIGLIFGWVTALTLAFLQWQNNAVNVTNSRLQTINTIAELRGQEKDALRDIITLADSRTGLFENKEHLPAPEVDRRAQPINAQMSLRIADFDAFERQLAKLEDRSPQPVPLDFLGPHAPQNLRLTP